MEYEYPKIIQIGGHTYSVELKPVYGLDKMAVNCGLHCAEYSTIEVATIGEIGIPRSNSRLNQLLWHEIIHAISYVFNSNLSEEQTDQVAQGLLQVLEQLGIRLVKEI